MLSQGAQHATHNSWRTNYCDVFLSFHSSDSYSFTRKLYKALLEKKINVFFDWGLEVSQTQHEMVHSIRESRVYVVVLSENYASSKWCLDELANIMEGVESTNKDNRKLCPVFYKVQQSDIVEKLSDGKQMAKLAKRFRCGVKTVQIFKSALTQIAHLPGWTWSERKESMIIHHMAELIHESLVGFDVFISFRNPDTGYNFTGNLYNALRQKKINTCFVDHELLKKMPGEDEPKFSPYVIKAINESRISIVVMSENYISSTLCLEELDNIIECMKTNKQLVWPIFYKVDPSHVRKQTAHVGAALAAHGNNSENGPMKMLKWKSSLTEVANLTGWPIETGYEYKFIQQIVESAVQSLSRYDVFLSFSAEDIHNSFARYLYNALWQAGFKTFMDEDGLDDGNMVSQKAIENSRHSLIILSENYAYSSWCLNDLVKIIECKKTSNHVIWPIFYKVDPSDVEYQRRSYEHALITHEKKIGKAAVQKWKSSLSDVIYIGGYWRENTSEVKYIENENESELIKQIVEHLHLDPHTRGKELIPGPSTGGFKIGLQPKKGKGPSI